MKKICIFPDCKLIIGYNRCIIYDLGRHTYYPIPKDLAKILINHNRKEDIESILNCYPKDKNFIINEYFDFLFSKEILFLTDTPEYFNEISDLHETYHIISNIIVEYSDKLNIDKLVDFINFANTSEVELRLDNFYDLDLILNKIDKSKLSSIVLIMPFTNSYNNEKLSKLKYSHRKITQIIIFNSPFEKHDYIDEYKITRLSYIKSNTDSLNNYISPMFFKVNIDFFTEALLFNTYYHKKVIIDKDGFVIDSFISKKSFVKFNELSNIDFIKLLDYNKLSLINKDKIDICMDCEFRYMCVDSRHINKIKGKYLCSEECPYNPYIAKWRGQIDWISTKQWRIENPDWQKTEVL